MTETPTVLFLFLCTHNAGRSVAAKILLDHYAEGRVDVRSAGSEPGDQLNPSVVAILKERGLDPSKEFPKPLADQDAREADVIVTMGCRDACPVYRASATSTGILRTRLASQLTSCGRSSTRSTAEFTACWTN